MKKKAFTLIELVVVIALVAILTAVASLSAKKRVEKDNYLKMKTVIPAVFRIYADKSFHDGETYTLTLDPSGSKITETSEEQELPVYYSYSVYEVEREYNSSEEEYEIKSASLLTSSADVDFTTNGDGIFDEFKLSSSGTPTGVTMLKHPSILVSKRDDSTVAYRVDILPGVATTKLVTYIPSGATSGDVGDKSKWIKDE